MLSSNWSKTSLVQRGLTNQNKDWSLLSQSDAKPKSHVTSLTRLFSRFSQVTYFSAHGTAYMYVLVDVKTSRKRELICKINSTHLKSHELVIRFRGPSINFNPVFRSNGKKFNAVKIYCNTKGKLINVLFLLGTLLSCRKM